MISTLKNDDGFVYGYIEWYVVDQDGKLEPKGDFIFVSHIWIHEKYKNLNEFRKLINLVDNHEFSKNCRWVYWAREKYDDRLKIFLREKFRKKVNKNVLVAI